MLGNEKMEEIAMGIIANAGGAKGCAFEAIQKAKKRDFAGAKESLRQAADFSLTAHNAHTELLSMDANGEVPGLDILLTHAQDHFMMASLAQDLAIELVDVYQALYEKEN